MWRRLLGVPVLSFPTDRIVGTLDWDTSWEEAGGPVFARGEVQVPDGDVGLTVQAVTEVGSAEGGSWWSQPSSIPVDLGFLRDFPVDGLRSLTVASAVEESMQAVAHLAPGLRRLTLAFTGFGDAVLPSVAALTGLMLLQTFGNAFSDGGVQVLAARTRLAGVRVDE